MQWINAQHYSDMDRFAFARRRSSLPSSSDTSFAPLPTLVFSVSVAAPPSPFRALVALRGSFAPFTAHLPAASHAPFHTVAPHHAIARRGAFPGHALESAAADLALFSTAPGSLADLVGWGAALVDRGARLADPSTSWLAGWSNCAAGLLLAGSTAAIAIVVVAVIAFFSPFPNPVPANRLSRRNFA
jgi:hypothetical protein